MLPGSLGPKPTKNQLDFLRTMAEGYELRYYTGIRSNGSAHFVKPDNPNSSKKARLDIIDRFRKWGWIEPTAPGDFRGTNYRITENGRKVAEKGEIRK